MEQTIQLLIKCDDVVPPMQTEWPLRAPSSGSPVSSFVMRWVTCVRFLNGYQAVLVSNKRRPSVQKEGTHRTAAASGPCPSSDRSDAIMLRMQYTSPVKHYGIAKILSDAWLLYATVVYTVGLDFHFANLRHNCSRSQKGRSTTMAYLL
eukprot:1147887-Pelagomonas_calceolata.AAC.5